jgi:hypothetical protein
MYPMYRLTTCLYGTPPSRVHLLVIICNCYECDDDSGHSAGGHMVGLLMTDPIFLGKHGLKSTMFKVSNHLISFHLFDYQI